MPSVAARSSLRRRRRRQVGRAHQVAVGEERLRLGQHGVRIAAAQQAHRLERRAIGRGALTGRHVRRDHRRLGVKLPAGGLAAATPLVLGAQPLRSHQPGRLDPRQQRIAVGQPVGRLGHGRLRVIEPPAGQRQTDRVRRAPVAGRGLQLTVRRARLAASGQLRHARLIEDPAAEDGHHVGLAHGVQLVEQVPRVGRHRGSHRCGRDGVEGRPVAVEPGRHALPGQSQRILPHLACDGVGGRPGGSGGVGLLLAARLTHAPADQREGIVAAIGGSPFGIDGQVDVERPGHLRGRMRRKALADPAVPRQRGGQPEMRHLMQDGEGGLGVADRDVSVTGGGLAQHGAGLGQRLDDHQRPGGPVRKPDRLVQAGQRVGEQPQRAAPPGGVIGPGANLQVDGALAQGHLALGGDVARRQRGGDAAPASGWGRAPLRFPAARRSRPARLATRRRRPAPRSRWAAGP